jgi:hypothetical protein
LKGLSELTAQVNTTFLFMGVDLITQVIKPAMLYLAWLVSSRSPQVALKKTAAANRSILQDLYVTHSQMVMEHVATIYSGLIFLIITRFTIENDANLSEGLLVASIVRAG